MSRYLVFALGVLGALAPEIVRLYEIRRAPRQVAWSWFYVAVSIPFAILGGVIALSLPATTSWAALYAGISTPVVVNKILERTVASESKGADEFKSPRTQRPSLRSLLRSFVKAL